jgi:hypothetical protein
MISTQGANKPENEKKKKPSLFQRLFGGKGKVAPKGTSGGASASRGILSGSGARGVGRAGISASRGGIFGGLKAALATPAGKLGAGLGVATMLAGGLLLSDLAKSPQDNGYSKALFQSGYYDSLVEQGERDKQARQMSSQKSGSDILKNLEATPQQNVNEGGSIDTGEGSGLVTEAETVSADQNASAGAGDSALADALAGSKVPPKLTPVSGFGGGGSSGPRGGGVGGTSNVNSLSAYKNGKGRGSVRGMANQSGARGESTKRSFKGLKSNTPSMQAVAVKGALAYAKGSELATAKQGMINAYETGELGDEGGLSTEGLGAAPIEPAKPSSSSYKSDAPKGGSAPDRNKDYGTANTNEPPPKIGGADDATPWKSKVEYAKMATLLAAAILTIIGLLEKFASATLVAKQWFGTLMNALRMIAMGLGAIVAISGVMFWVQDKQKALGGMYTAIGALIIWAARPKVSFTNDAKNFDESGKFIGKDVPGTGITRAIYGIISAAVQVFGSQTSAVKNDMKRLNEIEDDMNGNDAFE